MDRPATSPETRDASQLEITDSKVLVVAGMHRSGTSLATNWLARCGLAVGQDLVMGLPDNPTGHFEDRDFVSLHIDMLRDNGTDHLVTPGRRLVTQATQYERARELIRSKPPGVQWGWKDPRTTLFLPFWKSLIPQMKVLAVYRPYPEVVLSLLRRDYMRWQREHRLVDRFPLPLQRLAVPIHAALHVARTRFYLKVWERYNQDLLSFARSNPADVIVARFDDVVQRSVPLLNQINQRWGFSLQPLDARGVVVPDLIHHGPSRWELRYMSWLQPSVADTWQQLEQCRKQTVSALAVRVEDE